MSSLADRLRGIVGAGTVRAGTRESPSGDGDTAGRAAEILGGHWCESHGHRFLVVDRTYDATHRHGDVRIAEGLPSVAGAWPHLPLLTADAQGGGPLLFLDLETTGLAGGAGTYAFLVGCAWYHADTLRVRQFFLSSFSAERALLSSFAELAGQPGTLVTYNGKSFDLPLVETRFLYHRMPTPFGGVAHLDMLYLARRLWRQEPGQGVGGLDDRGGASCRLLAMEQALCGLVRHGDVPGFEIPSRYFHYVHTGNVGPLAAVFEHNRLDLVTLALLTARAALLAERGACGTRTVREAIGLGRLYEQRGRIEDASACYARAAGIGGSEVPGPPLTSDGMARAEALRAYAVLCRRQRKYAEAASIWKLAVDLGQCPPHILQEAAEALAVHHEHRLRDPHAARLFALQSMPLPASPGRKRALQHRLARLDRKLGTPGPRLAPLFPS